MLPQKKKKRRENNAKPPTTTTTTTTTKSTTATTTTSTYRYFNMHVPINCNPLSFSFIYILDFVIIRTNKNSTARAYDLIDRQQKTEEIDIKILK